jgi:hypothetical protein
MRFVAATVAAVVTLASVPVFANDGDAKDLFARGRELRSKGDCAGASPLFWKSYQLFPGGLGSLRNFAECEEQLGRYASARRAWLELKRALLVTKDSKYDGWDTDAEAGAARLAPKVARLTIMVIERGPTGEGPLTAESGVHVFINGESIDAKLLETALDRDPGTYRVRAEGGVAPIEKSVTLSAGDEKSLRLIVDLPGASGTTKPREDIPSTTDDTSSGSSRTLAYVALGVGAASAVGAGVFLALRASAKSDLEAACPYYESASASRPCPPSAEGAIDRGKGASTFASIFGAVAIVGIGTGLVLLATSPSKSSETTTSVRVSPWAGVGGGGAFLTGEF